MSEAVEEFLQAFQAALRLGWPEPVWHDRARRFQEIADLGLTRALVLEELQKLQPEHHHRGPEPDDEEPLASVVHKFRYPLCPGTDVYVKIALKTHPKKPHLQIPKIWSFKRWQ